MSVEGLRWTHVVVVAHGGEHAADQTEHLGLGRYTSAVEHGHAGEDATAVREDDCAGELGGTVTRTFQQRRTQGE